MEGILFFYCYLSLQYGKVRVVLMDTQKKKEPPMDKGSDPLWAVAQERVKFRFQLYLFLAITTLLWFIWLSTNLWNVWQFHRLQRAGFPTSVYPWTFPWPFYVMLIWGVVLVLFYLKAYSKLGTQAIEEEYAKLKGEKRDE